MEGVNIFEILENKNYSKNSSYFFFTDFDHENGVPVDLGFDPPKPKRKRESKAPAPRRSLRSTPARQTPPTKESPAEVYATPRAEPRDATPVRGEKTPKEKERRNTLTMDTPSQPKHRPRTRSMGTELQQTPRHEAKKSLDNSRYSYVTPPR